MTETQQKPKSGMGAVVSIAGLVIAAAWFLQPTHAGSTSAPIKLPVIDTPVSWTAPAGFQRFSGDMNIAYRWLSESEFTCTGDVCWGMYVVAHEGCSSSLYVELSLEDAKGNAIGYTNDVAGAVQPNQQAKLVFDSYEAGATKARLTDVSCY